MSIDLARASSAATITIKEAAELAGVDPRTLTGALSVHGGSIPSRRIGRRVVLPRQAFVEWLTGVQPPEPSDPDDTTRPAPSDATSAIRSKLIELLAALEEA